MIVGEVDDLIQQGKMDTALRLIKEKLPETNNELFFELILRQIHLLERQSDPQTASQLLEETIGKIPDQIDFINIRFHYLLTKVSILTTLGQIDTALEALNQLVELKQLFDIDKLLMTKYYTIQGNVNLKLGHVKTALSFQLSGLDYTKKHDLEERIQVFWNNIGIIYLYQGILEKALNYFTNCLTYIRGSQPNVEYETVYIMNIGRTHYFMQNFDLSRIYLQDAIKKAQKAQLTEKIVESMFYLILVEQELEEKIPQELIQNLFSLDTKNNPRIELFLKYMEGYVATFGDRVHHMAKAQAIFKDIIENDIIDHQIHFMSLLEFAEILFKEMDKFGPSDSIINELDQVLSKLLEESGEEHIYTIFTKSLVLKAKVRILQKKPLEAIDAFNTALTTADKHGLSYIKSQVSDIYDQFLPLLSSFLTGQLELTREELLENLNPQSIIDKIRLYETSEQPENEKPLLFLIISSGMSLLYSLKFDNTITLDENLIGNFLTALSAFGGRIFQTEKNSIQRIQIGEYMIIFRSVNNFLFSYTFKGPSYPATLKLDNFITYLYQHNVFETHLISNSLILNENEFKAIVLSKFVSN